MPRWIAALSVVAVMLTGSLGAEPGHAAAAPAALHPSLMGAATDIGAQRRSHRRPYADRPYYPYYHRPYYYAPKPFWPLPPLFGYGFEPW